MNTTLEPLQTEGASFGVSNPLDNASLQGFLERAKDHDPETFLAFWLSAGTRLAQCELDALRWEHFTQCGTTIRSIVERVAVEAKLAPEAIEQISEFRKAEGPVLEGRVWPNHLRLLLRWSESPDISSFRDFLSAPDVRRVRRDPAQSRPALPSGAPVRSETPITPPVQNGSPGPNQTQKRCIPIATAAASLGMSVRWVIERIKAGELQGYRLGHKLMIDTASLDGFLRARAIGKETE